MTKDYTTRLENLQKRRHDDNLNKAILTESFSNPDISKSVKYALEAMSEIDPKYTQNTYLAADGIKTNLTNGLKEKGLTVEYRYQGSVETNTHIKIHSDIDLLVFTEKFATIEPPLVNSFPYEGDALIDLKNLRQDCYSILNSIYSQVNNSKAKCIEVYPTNPKRQVDVVICNWLNTLEAQNYNSEIYRGVRVYDKDKNDRTKDFPFLHIAKIKEKDKSVNLGLRKLTRLLKTLKADAELDGYAINLSSFEIISVVYAMSSEALSKLPNRQLLLLEEGSKHLNKLIIDSNYRQNLLSPNGKEVIFGNSESKLVEIKKLKLEIDELIQDTTEELNTKLRTFSEPIIYS